MKKWVSVFVVLMIIMGLFGCGNEGGKTEGTLTIYLVRHGQTDTNVQGLLVGQSGDPQLTEEGRENAKKLGEALSSVQFDAAYSSELTRAYDTACLLLQGADEEMTVEKVAEFNDISWGNAEGMTWESVSKEYSVADMEQCFGAIDDSEFISPMNAESKYDFCNRFSQGIDKVIANQKPNDTVLIVAHSSLAFYLQRLFPEQGISGVDNTSITVVTYDYATDEFSLEKLNDTSYLECFLYQVNTKHIKSKRLVLHTLNTDYEYIDCVKRGRNPKYETKTIHGYAEAFINLIEAPIVVNGKVI